MAPQTDSNDDLQGQCPICQQMMTLQSLRHYYCPACQCNYYESYICPLCGQALNQIKGCGAINYLCQTDGLISSRNIRFHYLAQ